MQIVKKKRNANSNLKCPLCSPVSPVLKKVLAIAGPQLNHRWLSSMRNTMGIITIGGITLFWIIIKIS